MAGNDSDARQAKQDAYNTAKKAGVKGDTLETLYADYAAAQAVENSSCGTSHTAKR